MALRNSSESPILSSSATVHPPSVDWSLLKEPHGGRLRQQPLPFTHLRGHYPHPLIARRREPHPGGHDRRPSRSRRATVTCTKVHLGVCYTIRKHPHAHGYGRA